MGSQPTTGIKYNCRWSDKERDFITKNHRKLPVKSIARTLRRTEKATRTQIERMDIRLSNLPRNKRKRWTEREIRILKTLSKNTSGAEIGRELGRGRGSIYAKLHELGIKSYRKRRDIKSGYYRIRTDEGWKYEHILNMEKHIGRKLRKKERVHHINYDKLDNRIENLYLCRDRSHHTQLHWNGNGLLQQLLRRNIISFNPIKGEYIWKD